MTLEAGTDGVIRITLGAGGKFTFTVFDFLREVNPWIATRARGS
ncbi:MAG: hypothetical protein AAFU85_09780 [Planctomycetota bacterium]